MLRKLYHKLWSNIEKKNKKLEFLENSSVVTHLNLLYGEDKKNNSYDVYIPNSLNKKYPTIFTFHGGGYISGTKEGTRNFCQILASKGYLVFNIEYTKCDCEEKKYFPYQVYEFFKFYKNITEYSNFVNIIDFDNIFLSGESAGAHIAALIANIQTNPELKMDYSVQGGPKVKGVILMSPSFGIYKFAGFFPKNKYFNVIFGNKNVRDPIYTLTHNLDITTEAFPPTIMFSVKGDFVVGAHKERFLNLAKELNLSVQHYDICSGYKLFHSSMLNHPEHYPIFFDKIESFINNACNNYFIEGLYNSQIYEDTNDTSLQKTSMI